MCQAHELQGQPFSDSLETPENPGGQSSAKRRDGTKVCRHKFAHEAYKIAMDTLEREKTRRHKR